VVAGTAGAVGHRQQQKYAAQEQAAYESQQQAAMEQQMAQQQMQMQQMQQQMAQQQASAAPAPAAAGSPMMDQLNQLAQMHTAGILSDEEFAAAKQRLLAGG
jgi:isopentenyl phosphate kinase